LEKLNFWSIIFNLQKDMILKVNLILLSLLYLISGNVFAVNINKLTEVASLDVDAIVLPYTKVSVSTNELSFNILGTPGTYTSKDVVTLTVDSNQSTWGVYAQATNLLHDKVGFSALPAERLTLSVNDQEYKSLDSNVLFLRGTIDKEAKPVYLRFRLTTTWKDSPGIYKGKVTIAILNNP